MGGRRSQMHLPEEREPRVGSAASDRLAPMQCGASSEARRRPRSLARTCGGAISSGPPNYERAPTRVSLHQSPKCGEEQERLNKGIPDTPISATLLDGVRSLSVRRIAETSYCLRMISSGSRCPLCADVALRVGIMLAADVGHCRASCAATSCAAARMSRASADAFMRSSWLPRPTAARVWVIVPLPFRTGTATIVTPAM